ncbi:enoyl-CoA hydratase-related protein [Lachnospiraceae bacterium ZAX-1]
MSDSSNDIVLTEHRDGKGIIAINRPKVLNAIDWETFFILQKEFDEMVLDDTVRVIILTGTGERAFISGGDIGEELKMDGLTSYRWSLVGHKLCASIEASPKPVIAAVNGYALGGGFEIALACDFRICSENAKFGTPESKLGVCCGFGGNVRLPRVVGAAKAKEILMTGQMIDSAEAYRLNLVNLVVPQKELMNRVDAFCENLVNKSFNVLDVIKRAVDYGSEIDLRSAAQYEAALFGIISATEDKKEGMTAFLEKRPPVFTDK